MSRVTFMNRVTLYFPNTTLMAEFILTHRVSNIITNSAVCSLIGTLSQDQVAIAIKRYGAKLSKNQLT